MSRAEKLSAIATRLGELRDSGVDMVMVEKIVGQGATAPSTGNRHPRRKGERRASHSGSDIPTDRRNPT